MLTSGESESSPKFVKLARNGTNPGHFGSPIWKSPGFVPFGTYLIHIGPKSDSHCLTAVKREDGGEGNTFRQLPRTVEKGEKNEDLFKLKKPIDSLLS